LQRRDFKAPDFSAAIAWTAALAPATVV